MLQMMQEMHNRMISFEHRLIVYPKLTTAPPFCIMARSETPQSSESFMCHWCNFCDEPHDPTTCETFLFAKERAKGKKNMPTVVAIETEEISYEFYTIVTRSQTQFWPTPLNGPSPGLSKVSFNDKFIPKPSLPEIRATLISHSLNIVTTQSVGLSGYMPYNVVADLANLKANISFLEVLRAPEQQQNMSNSLATSKITSSPFKPRPTQSANIVDFEEQYSEREVNATIPSRPEPKYPPFYVSIKIMWKIAHSCLIDGGSSPNIMSKVIMEQLGLNCTGEARNMLTFNKKVQRTIGQIKDLTLTLCSYREVKTTWNFVVADMEVGNFSWF